MSSLTKSLSRRSLLGAVAAAASVSAQSRKDESAPNILLIMGSDIGAWMLGCYGNQEIKTPNLDNLARRGARFVNAFACTPMGGPSRATLLSCSGPHSAAALPTCRARSSIGRATDS